MYYKKRLNGTDIILAPFSIGTSTFGNMYGNITSTTIKNIVTTAINNGLNYFKMVCHMI